MDENILNILVCPRCKRELVLVEGGKGLLCEHCRLKYLVKDGVPIMLPSEAQSMAPEAKQEISLSNDTSSVLFRVIEGPDKGRVLTLKLGTCAAIGRVEDSSEKTRMFNVDVGLTLDESTKRLILRYISKQFRKPITESREEKGKIGAFYRVRDFLLNDSGISRLHAMVFYDEAGVGVLDLVSKNGTFVNGKEIESYLLKEDDVLEIGETKILFEGSKTVQA